MKDGLRTHTHEEVFDATPEALFDLLIRPSAIRMWWGASRVIVVPEPGGLWAAAWGEEEDDPDYVTSAVMSVFEPPTRLEMSDYAYFARSGPLPFEAQFTTSFETQKRADGTALIMRQHGFPHGESGDEFLDACDRGWRETFAGIRRFLAERHVT